MVALPCGRRSDHVLSTTRDQVQDAVEDLGEARLGERLFPQAWEKAMQTLNLDLDENQRQSTSPRPRG